MELEEKITKFFYLSKKMFTLHQLKRIFQITPSEEETFLNALDNLITQNVIFQKNGRYYSHYEKDELAKKLEEFFATHNKIYEISTLEKIFNINSFNRVSFYNCLNDLEIRGKIFCLNNKSFVHVPEDSYLKSGCLMESNQGNYYIKVDDRIITIDDIKNAKVFDIVFVVEELDKRKHPKHGFGRIIRVVKPLNASHNKEYLTSGIINRDVKNDTYFFEQDLSKIYINKKNLNGAYPSDKVNLLVTFDNNNKPSARVINILERKNNKHVFKYKNGKWHPIGTEEFNISFEDDYPHEEDDQIIASVSLEKTAGNYTLNLIERIDKDRQTPRDKIKIQAIDRGLSFDFDAKVLQEANKLKKEIPACEIAKRLDLRNLETFTIDSAYAKDLDDAVSLEKTKDGYRLYVHIADVSYYVKPGTALFADYLRRGTSIYFGDMVIPELPEIISNGLCSLNPNEDKLTKTLIMEFTDEGILKDFSLHNSVIRSNKKMSYDKVNDLLNGVNFDSSYLPFYNTLVNMHNLANKLEEERIKRGSTSFTSTEYIFELDENGKPISLSERNDGPAQKIIEHFMIATNQTLAEYAYWLNLPYVYRNHECPQLDKINILNAKLKPLIQRFKKIKDLNNPRLLQKYYEEVCKNKSSSEIRYLSNIFLQSLPRAYYEDINKGHYGLALSYYATFTSPIRRGPDLLNHLFLGEVIEKGIDTELLEKMRPKLATISKELSNRQQEAESFEQEIDYLLLKEYASEFFNQELTAVIDFIMDDKIFIRTENNLTGIIQLDGNYNYDVDKNLLIDATRNIKYKVGDEIKAKITSFDSRKHHIIFSLCPKKEKELPKKHQKEKK